MRKSDTKTLFANDQQCFQKLMISKNHCFIMLFNLPKNVCRVVHLECTILFIHTTLVITVFVKQTQYYVSVIVPWSQNENFKHRKTFSLQIGLCSYPHIRS